MGYLNSSVAFFCLRLINPTVNYQAGDVSKLPLPRVASAQLRNLVHKAIATATIDGSEDETTYNYVSPSIWPDGLGIVKSRREELAALEREIDEEVFRLYALSSEDRKAVEVELTEPEGIVDSRNDIHEEDSPGSDSEDEEDIPLSTKELAARWIGYVTGVALGRFNPGIAGALGCGHFSANVSARLRDLADKDGMMVLEEGHPDDLGRRVIDILSAIYGDAESEKIVRVTTGSVAPLRDAVDAYLSGDFFRDHVKRYRKRPIYWLIQSPKKNYSVYLFHEKATLDTLSLLRGNRYLGGRLNRLQQEQASLRAAVLKGDRGAARKAGLVAEQIEELQEFDRRIEAATQVSVKDRDGHDVTARWEPELDDGVYINAAPLHELLPSWRDVNPKKAWQELIAGDYDWSKTAMRYWPQKVLARCKDNKSYAIAHGLA